MKTSEILAPLFDIINKIHCDTDLEIKVDICSYDSFKQMNWYIGDPNKFDEDEHGRLIYPHGSLHDWLKVDDLDEDKLESWLTQLNHLYDEALGLIDEPEDEDEESESDIARYENHRINSQEDRKI